MNSRLRKINRLIVIYYPVLINWLFVASLRKIFSEKLRAVWVLFTSFHLISILSTWLGWDGEVIGNELWLSKLNIGLSWGHQCTSCFVVILFNFIILYLPYFQELPTTIGRWKHLTNFNVDRNRLTEIPKEVCLLSALHAVFSCLIVTVLDHCQLRFIFLWLNLYKRSISGSLYAHVDNYPWDFSFLAWVLGICFGYEIRIFSLSLCLAM